MNNVKAATILAAVFGLLSLSRVALAHDDGACREDVKKLCGDVQPGGGAYWDCMKNHMGDLSQGCKDNMAEARKKHEERKKELVQACQADIKQFCANVTPGQGREIACLKSFEDKISAGCKEKMPKFGMHKGMHHDGDMGKGKDNGDKEDHGDKDHEDPADGTDGPPAGK